MNHQRIGRPARGRKTVEHPDDVMEMERLLDFHRKASTAELLNDAENREPAPMGRWVSDIEEPRRV